MDLKEITLSASVARQLIKWTECGTEPRINLAFPIVPKGESYYEDKRNGEIAVSRRVKQTISTGKGKDRMTEHKEVSEARVYCDTPVSGNYYRIEIREEETFLALLGHWVRKGAERIKIRLSHPWAGSNYEAHRVATFALPGIKPTDAPSRGTVFSLYVYPADGAWYCGGTSMTALQFDYSYERHEGDALSECYDAKWERLPLYGVDQSPEWRAPAEESACG